MGEEKTMAKVSRSTASHMEIPGFVDSFEQEVDGWDVSIDHYLTDMDMAPFFKGGPHDLCPARHVGYVLKGTFGVRRADGVEETYEAGEAFVLEPGHTPIVHAGLEYVAFTPSVDAKRQMEVMMPNVSAFAREHGIELPGQRSA